MEFVLPALISSIATLLAVWLQSFLNKRKIKKESHAFGELINSSKIKKFYVVMKDDKEDKKIFLSKASSYEEDLELVCKETNLKTITEFSDKKHLNYENIGIMKDFSEKINQRINNG